MKKLSNSLKNKVIYLPVAIICIIVAGTMLYILVPRQDKEAEEKSIGIEISGIPTSTGDAYLDNADETEKEDTDISIEDDWGFFRQTRIIYNSYLFDFGRNGKYNGFFDSINPYVEGYEYRIFREDDSTYIIINNPDQTSRIRWDIIFIEGYYYLSHESSGTLIPIPTEDLK